MSSLQKTLLKKYINIDIYIYNINYYKNNNKYLYFLPLIITYE